LLPRKLAGVYVWWQQHRRKSFLVLFFKKEHFFCPGTEAPGLNGWPGLGILCYSKVERAGDFRG
jgi:hypothetical protein